MTGTQKQERDRGHWDEATWIAVGAGVGVALGAAFGDGVGAGMGVALGAGLGAAVAAWRTRHGPHATG